MERARGHPHIEVTHTEAQRGVSRDTGGAGVTRVDGWNRGLQRGKW